MIYMTEPHVASGVTLDMANDPGLTTDTVSRTPILITEREVAFATAAAVPVPSAIRGMFATSTADSRPARRHYRPRTDIFEHSRMAREMYRP
jgi:hypothetical protein